MKKAPANSSIGEWCWCADNDDGTVVVVVLFFIDTRVFEYKFNDDVFVCDKKILLIFMRWTALLSLAIVTVRSCFVLYQPHTIGTTLHVVIISFRFLVFSPFLSSNLCYVLSVYMSYCCMVWSIDIHMPFISFKCA